jgi:uncharacterized protein
MALFRTITAVLAGACLAGSVHAATDERSQLETRMAITYSDALKKSDAAAAKVLKSEQQSWERRRDGCANSKDKPKCVRDSYEGRIAELQARYRLLPGHPMKFTCDGDPRKVVSVTIYDTQPRTLIAEFGDKVSLMYAKPSDRGARYEGTNESFSEYHGVARIIWGRKSSEMYCKPTA